MGGSSFGLLYWTIGKILGSGSSLIVDVDFSLPVPAKKRIEHFGISNSIAIKQINLIAEGSVLMERFKKRSLSGSRHPGHVDHMNFEELQPILIKGKRESASLVTDFLEIDSTYFEKVDYKRIINFICV